MYDGSGVRMNAKQSKVQYHGRGGPRSEPSSPKKVWVRPTQSGSVARMRAFIHNNVVQCIATIEKLEMCAAMNRLALRFRISPTTGRRLFMSALRFSPMRKQADGNYLRLMARAFVHRWKIMDGWMDGWNNRSSLVG